MLSAVNTRGAGASLIYSKAAELDTPVFPPSAAEICIPTAEDPGSELTSASAADQLIYWTFIIESHVLLQSALFNIKARQLIPLVPTALRIFSNKSERTPN